jgi:AraC-like DNA-binding protein
MDMIWSRSRILNLLQDFYIIAKVRVGFFDPEGKEILAYPSTLSGFCILIRSNKKGNDACVKCDRVAFQHASRRQGLYIYQCHAGLTEVIVPIRNSRGERIANLMVGQIQPPGGATGRQWEEICRKVKALNPDLRRLKAEYQRLPSIKMDQVRSCANILQALATYVWLDNYIRVQDEPLSSRIEKYIIDNPDHTLSISVLAGEFGVGKTTLCKVLKRDLKITVNGLIRKTRIERAQQLLQSGGQSIADIAEQVGIMDYNYFTKVFKEETGVPPSIFRKLCEGEYLYNSQKA